MFPNEFPLTDPPTTFKLNESPEINGGRIMTCVVCLAHPRDLKINPCSHSCICHRCAFQLTKEAVPSCPICNIEIKSFAQFSDFGFYFSTPEIKPHTNPPKIEMVFQFKLLEMGITSIISSILDIPKINDEVNHGEDIMTCIICFTNTRKLIIKPCSHGCVCGKCAKILTKQNVPQCPLCRTKIESFEKFFL